MAQTGKFRPICNLVTLKKTRTGSFCRTLWIVHVLSDFLLEFLNSNLIFSVNLFEFVSSPEGSFYKGAMQKLCAFATVCDYSFVLYIGTKPILKNFPFGTMVRSSG
jgi:hypothetical protein